MKEMKDIGVKDIYARLAAASDRLIDMGFRGIIDGGGRMYLVGGFVRDSVLDIKSKDIDVIITDMPMKRIMEILGKHGKVDLVGKSFAVLKFTAGGETIDVAIPRKDEHVEGGGHQDVIVHTENVTLTEDLRRRDFTINAMAWDVVDCDLIDPFEAISDLYGKVIRHIDGDVFAMDPLRMLRAVVFATRLDFAIHGDTEKLIRDHAEWITRITGERIREELQKVWTKQAGWLKLVYLLHYTGLFDHIFGEDRHTLAFDKHEPKEMTYADFFYCVLQTLPDPEKTFKTVLKGDAIMWNEIGAITRLVRNPETTTVKRRQALYDEFQKAPGIVYSKVLLHAYSDTMPDFLAGKYPKFRKELLTDGYDLEQAGVKKVDMGFVFARLIDLLLSDQVKNKRRELFEAARHVNNAMNKEE